LVGYLAPSEHADLVLPMSLVGVPIGRALPDADAGRLLDERGLATLGERWWCRLPNPMPTGGVDATSPAAEWAWRSVLLVEVNPQTVRVRLELASPEELRSQATLPVPVNALLRREQPVD
jgi:hypothetical protein